VVTVPKLWWLSGQAFVRGITLGPATYDSQARPGLLCRRNRCRTVTTAITATVVAANSATLTASPASPGGVQYHFATKDQLLLAAYRRVIDDVTARAREIAARDAGPAAYIRALVHELLPLDDRREAELRVAVAFTARSVHSPSLTALYTDGYRALTGAIAGALQLAVARGEAIATLDAQLDRLLPGVADAPGPY
jgi:hypothetical protein